MAERTLENRYRLLAASFRDGPRAAAVREDLGGDFARALDLIVFVLAHDVLVAPRDLDRARVEELLRAILPGRTQGRDPWVRALPDVLDAFLGHVAEEEGLTASWEWSTAIAETREAFDDAITRSDRTPPGGLPPMRPDKRPAPKIGRNDPCFCGSGRKYKNCCLRLLP